MRLIGGASASYSLNNFPGSVNTTLLLWPHAACCIMLTAKAISRASRREFAIVFRQRKKPPWESKNPVKRGRHGTPPVPPPRGGRRSCFLKAIPVMIFTLFYETILTINK
jgi:hypothetical protein